MTGNKGFSFQPVIIIGAPRSGTNLLRDLLTQIDTWDTWDCDEINMIWRHGNVGKSNDVLDASHVSPKISNYIRGQFSKLAKKNSSSVVVEKTCANSLRVDFIRAIFPEAKFIFIVRDGRAASLSAKKRWEAPIEVGYTSKKIRFTPLTDVPYYAKKYLFNRIYQLFSKERRQFSWGPKFDGMDEWARKPDPLEVCAKQWSECVESSMNSFEKIDESNVFNMRYEDLVTSPKNVLAEFLDWFGADGQIMVESIDFANVNPGGGSRWINSQNLISDKVQKILTPTLSRLGYEDPA